MKINLPAASIAAMKDNASDALSPLGLADLGHSKQLDLIARFLGYSSFGALKNDPRATISSIPWLSEIINIRDDRGKLVTPSEKQISDAVRKDLDYYQKPDTHPDQISYSTDIFELVRAFNAAGDNATQVFGQPFVNSSERAPGVQTFIEIGHELGIIDDLKGEAIHVEWNDSSNTTASQGRSSCAMLIVPESDIAYGHNVFETDREIVSDPPYWMNIRSALLKCLHDSGGSSPAMELYHPPGSRQNKDKALAKAIDGFLLLKWLSM